MWKLVDRFDKTVGFANSHQQAYKMRRDAALRLGIGQHNFMVKRATEDDQSDLFWTQFEQAQRDYDRIFEVDRAAN